MVNPVLPKSFKYVNLFSYKVSNTSHTTLCNLSFREDLGKNSSESCHLDIMILVFSYLVENVASVLRK